MAWGKGRQDPVVEEEEEEEVVETPDLFHPEEYTCGHDPELRVVTTCEGKVAVVCLGCGLAKEVKWAAKQ